MPSPSAIASATTTAKIRTCKGPSRRSAYRPPRGPRRHPGPVRSQPRPPSGAEWRQVTPCPRPRHRTSAPASCSSTKPAVCGSWLEGSLAPATGAGGPEGGSRPADQGGVMLAEQRAHVGMSPRVVQRLHETVNGRRDHDQVSSRPARRVPEGGRGAARHDADASRDVDIGLVDAEGQRAFEHVPRCVDRDFARPTTRSPTRATTTSTAPASGRTSMSA